MSELTVFTDGGSRGNPGPAAIGVYITDGTLEVRHKKYLGTTTNNVAEYTAVLEALALLKSLLAEHPQVTAVSFFLDSELVVRQLTGIYKVKDPGLRVLYNQVLQEMATLPVPVRFTHVLRGRNKVADSLVNAALDAV